ncbi:MAG TPA: SCO family protein [Polyangia bacterium]|nr:SCO family protein [Polyangia bacterium]
MTTPVSEHPSERSSEHPSEHSSTGSPAGFSTGFRPRQPAAARLAGNPLVWAALLGLLFGVPIFRSVTRRLGASPAILGALPPFALTDQRGQPFGTRELAGKVWVADFIFTSCQEACPLLSQKMAEVGHRARRLGPDFHLVSFSVDPTRDTPARLAEYATRYGANPLAWSFLTGPADAIEAAVVGGFKEGMGKEKVTAPGNADDQQGFWQIFHGEHLVLVDRQLRIRGYFEATPQGLDLLMAAAGRVANGA